ncbi:rab proteins geranylgeranyltransferase component A [Episyrphus balteatus]|uniref:rab proteins geranylgeranyltransferase component A n=1 Tax=Episyrphus balteatus TaxID=286459 RepID=UPI002484FD88|nr:rab proteins geranylgeranyltransferase component A [Episyrphus balteatus]
MDEELSKEFDLVVVGTGFTESAVAAAASRIGKTVLHVDPNDFYGSCWASFNLENFQSFLANNITTETNEIAFTKQNWLIPTSSEEEQVDNDNQIPSTNEDNWTQSKILKNSRKFNIDLTPKLLFSAGKLVELLVSSNICRYAEFRAIDRISTLYNGELLNVPSSRTDVFNTKDLSIVEKRLLMKLLTSCMGFDDKSEEFLKYQDKTFLEYLQANKLTEKIIHCVMNSIAMCNETTPLNEGVEKMKNYLQSLGRYGNSPFLFPMYGCGEIPQCFCRLCAVFGGTYCLKRKVNVVSTKEDAITLQVDGHILDAKHLVVSSGSMPQGVIPSNCLIEGQHKCGNLVRGVYITSTPIGNEDQNSGGGGVNVIRLIDSADSSRGAILLQLSHYSGTCPKGLYLIHITAEAISNDPEADLEPFAKQVFNNEIAGSPKLLFAAYFLIKRCKICQQTETTSVNQIPRLLSTCGPFFEIDYDSSIQNAKDVFDRIYPNESFLPRAPDPEEIIIGDEDPVALAEHTLAEDLKQHMHAIEGGMESMDVCEENAGDA